MRATWILVALALVMLVLVPGRLSAIPRCEQVLNLCEPDFFGPKQVSFGECSQQTGQRTWQCLFKPGDDWIPSGQSGWCWCNDHPGCDCLLEGTPITLADGTTKPVEAIQAGDQVLAFDESTGAMIQSLVIKTHPTLVAPNYFIINERLRLTENHPVLSRGSWVAAGSLKIGDQLTTAGVSFPTIMTQI